MIHASNTNILIISGRWPVGKPKILGRTMQSFSRKKSQETDPLIKESLLQQLSYSVKEVQLLVSKRNEVLSTNEESNSLIVVLEAIFLHGLKKGLLKTAIKTVAGGDDAKPQPSFWNMVCNYTHKNTISIIKNLSQVKTDVGRCRVWVRLALNEGELTSYFAAMEKDRRALNSSYSNHSFLRDREICDTACKLLEGILTVSFEIPVNSSILNIWSSEPLMLSGAWLPAIKTPLSTGVDIAEKIEDDPYDEDDTSSIKTSSSITTLSTILALDETQALRMILETPVKKLSKDVTPSSTLPSPLTKIDDDLILEEDEHEIQEEEMQENEISDETKGNSLANAHGWSSTEETDEIEKDVKIEEYSTLLENLGISPSNKINYEEKLKEMMQKQNKNKPTDFSKTSSNDSNYDNSYNSKLYKIVREIGLKTQKYTCANCQLSIGLSFGEARLCFFTGEHYCDKCHLNETSVIPSRLLFNWDHQKYPVCTNAYKYLNDICSRFLIDIKKVNPRLYAVVKNMNELRHIRIQLNILRAYFYTCREPILLELQKKVKPREYLYEFIDHYSINDLCQVPGGYLADELSALISFGKNHVLNCGLCSQKGFICEVCKNSKVIYPFDVSSTYRCSKCYSLYHLDCLPSSKSCPKCKRLKKRTLSQQEPFTTGPE